MGSQRDPMGTQPGPQMGRRVNFPRLLRALRAHCAHDARHTLSMDVDNGADGIRAPPMRKSHAEKRHNLYGPADEIKALDALATYNKDHGLAHKSRSALIMNEVRKLLRTKAGKIRRMGVEIPESCYPRKSFQRATGGRG